ncbi:DUF1707 domain-containing protein [Amycolatopsis sp. AA4]|uniref:DUF1707 SHOCT-like domain-containing protein n=1 Tax=Actinomycetes TaxID=1760 RepID=UPI0001B57605|nr:MULTISPECIES: DUF1707 domain-containing protein [Actinomycetes]ATY14747.1 DUF1707 domain-containing protein [Amycolatopsis sp. AA4]EFL10886.1 predicted protein [Streptomyces sp. AA4]
MTDDRPVRCSDAEREQTTKALNAAAGEGRLSLAEVEERVTTVYAAQYRHELDAVVADLPSPAPRTRWQPLLLLAGHQLVTEFGTAPPRRKLAAGILLMFAVAMLVFLAAHGFADEGHHFGRH